MTDASSENLALAQIRTPEHYDWLDALRGVAALIVVVSHLSIFGLYGYEHTLATYPPTRLLWAGHQAVILFFVISGFSLFLLYESISGGKRRWLNFIAVRIARLYLPYAASIVLGLGLLAAPRYINITPSSAAPVIAHGYASSRELINQFLMIGIFDVRAINPPIWSLVHEMRLSIIFPLLYALAVRVTWKTAMIVAACWIIGVFFIAISKPPGAPIVMSLLVTAHYGMCFLIGAMIARHRILLRDWLTSLQSRTKIALLFFAVVLFMYSYGYNWPAFFPKWSLFIADMSSAAASSYFVLFAISCRLPMNIGALKFFGRISYSLYLTHQIVIMTVILLFFGKLPAHILWIISIVGIVFVAGLFFKTIESPSLRFSRAIRSRPL